MGMCGVVMDGVRSRNKRTKDQNRIDIGKVYCALRI